MMLLLLALRDSNLSHCFLEKKDQLFFSLKRLTNWSESEEFHSCRS